MEEILVIFACDGLTVNTDIISGRVVDHFIDDVCKVNSWEFISKMEFTAFYYVEVK